MWAQWRLVCGPEGLRLWAATHRGLLRGLRVGVVVDDNSTTALRQKPFQVSAFWRRYCSNSTSFKEQRQHLQESFTRDITPEYCAKVYEHVQHIEERYWTTDLLIDEDIELEDDEGSPF